MTQSDHNTQEIKLAQALLLLNALTWLIFGIVSLLRLGEQNSDLLTGLIIIALLMFGNAGALLASAWLLRRQEKIVFAFVLAVLLINIVLTFTDQFGLYDALTVFVDFAVLAIMLRQRRRWLA